MDSFGWIGRRRGFGFALGVAMLGALVVIPIGPATVLAAPAPLLWQATGGTGAGQTNIPGGIAADPDSGRVYVGDQGNARIVEFTAWGNFVKAWGWDVVATGPGDDVSVPEDQFESCVPANGDVCKAGIDGGGAGQLTFPQGVAVNSSGEVFVTEGNFGNRRVQVFDPSAGPSGDEAQFERMFGGEVNKTKVEAAAPVAEQNLCPVAPTDVCQAATNGAGPGQFDNGAFFIFGDFIAIDSADKVYVGDLGRIQRFNTAGAYQGEIALPGKIVQSLATDTDGNLYATYNKSLDNLSLADVHKLDPGGAPAAIETQTFAIPNPTAVTVDADGNVYAFDQSAVNTGSPQFARPPIVEFDPAGNQIASIGKGEFNASTGIAANICADGLAPDSSAPGSLYISNFEPESFVRAYSTPPIGCEIQPDAAPDIKVQYAVAVDPDGAQLRATINPEFWPQTTYFVEYGTGECAAGGCTERAPLGAEAQLGDGKTVTNADLTSSSVFLNGLAANTTYHYRFVAKSPGGGPEFGTRPPGEDEATFADGGEATFITPPPPSPSEAVCPNQVFRTGPSAFLPDCRAFEMVSPVDKNGAGIETALAGGNPLAHGALDQSAADGEGLTYSSKQAFGDSVASPFSSQYLARRDPLNGWSTHGLNALREGLPGLERQALDTEFKAFTENLSQAWLIHEGEPRLGPCAPLNSTVLYHRDNLADAYEALHCKPNLPKNGPGTIELQGVSKDGCRAVFRSNSPLTDDALPTGPYQLYESSCSGPLRLVSVLPGGTACNDNSSAGSLLNIGGEINDGRSKPVQNAFSTDAKRLYWSCGNTLYLRNDPNPAAIGELGEETVKVAAPVVPNPLEPQQQESPRFQAASPDGETALITAYDVGAGSFALQSYAAGKTVSTIAAGLGKGTERTDILGASEDATRVYFTSEEKLSAVPNQFGDEPVIGKPNLYYHQIGGGFSFIGVLSQQDLTKSGRVISPIHPIRYRRASRVNPDGLQAAFISTAPLTGYDNIDAISGEIDAEVFVYDAASGGGEALHCVSCNPSGSRPIGRNISREIFKDVEFWAAAWIPGWQTQLYQGSPLSNDGSRLFFNSIDALVPRDTNNRQDVYEWERADSKEECLQELGAEMYVPSAAGCISLISSGQDAEDSAFVDADRDGSDVFIRTGQSLLVQDPGLLDIYDARVNGGFPPPPAPRPECEGEACQSPPPPPIFGAPASSNYAGPPNPKPGKAKRCRKGKKRVQRGGKTRCVAKKHKRNRGANRKQGRAAR
jgi:DNA-binding beta-propeller fold protein YncE